MVKPSGASNWSKPETDHLLSILENIVPFQPAEWEEVKVKFDVKFGKKKRAVKALQRRFTLLHRKKEPTGDSNIPSPVLRAQMIRDMIDEKTDGTRGSPDSELNLLGGDDDEEEMEGSTAGDNNITGVRLFNNEEGDAMTPLTHKAVLQLSRLSRHTEQPHFEPVVQVCSLRKKPNSDVHEITISDGIHYMLGTCAQPVSSLIDEQYFTLFSFIKVQEFATTTAANGNKSIQLICVENPMIPNPGEKIGNPVNFWQPDVPALPKRAPRAQSPPPTSIQFTQNLRAMRGSSSKTRAGVGSSGDEFNNIMRMMLMQQQSDREQRMADCDHCIFLAEQNKLEHERREHQQQLDREEREKQAREDRLQQQQDQMQQQQFMNMMMMHMMGGKKNKRASEESDSDNENREMTGAAKDPTPKKTPRKK
jgi:hypothetical protein